MPHFPDVKKGELIYMSVKMYFDQTEIKIEVTIRDRIFTCTSKYESNEKGLMLKQDLRPSVSTPAPSFIPPPTQNYRGSASDSESDTESPKEKKPNTFEKTWKKIVRALE
jgi:hypothetical protein